MSAPNPHPHGMLPQGDAARTRVARRAVVAAIALGAAGAGAWWGWRQRQLGAATEAPLAFWRDSLPTPGGQPQPLAAFLGRPTLVNFWATWCPPCVEELPLLARFHAENASNGVQVLGLAVDKAEPVQHFLARAPVGFTVLMAGLQGVALTRQLGNTAGGLPFSVLFGRDGRVLARKLGQLREPDLAAWRQLGEAMA